jgi:hypothetical protein
LAVEKKTTNKGKAAELFVFGELLNSGADLYVPLVDMGVDAVLRRSDGTYVEIQVKSTEEDDQAGYFNVYDLGEHPEDRFFIVCVDMNERNRKTEGKPNVWVLSSKDFKEYMVAGCRLPIYERSHKHGNVQRCELLKDRFYDWEHLIG